MVPFTSRPSRALGLLLTLLAIGCNPPSEQPAPKTESGLVLEGKIDVVMELSKVDLEKGLQMINRNYIMGPDAAYYLWLVPKTKLLGSDRQSGGNAMNIPAPEGLGDVVIYTGAKYRVAGEPVSPPTGDELLDQVATELPKSHQNRPVRLLVVDQLELIEPEPGYGSSPNPAARADG